MPNTTNEPSVKEAMRLTRAKLNRLSWALNAYGHFLAAAVRQDTSQEAREVENLPDEQVPAHVARLIQDRADPTVAKTMTGWLVKQYAERALRLEDLGTAYETLDMFHRYAQRLPKGEQDLGQYPNLARVWEVVSPIAQADQENLSGKSQKARDRDKAYAESHILRQDPDGFTIAVPLTEFAAKWWGRGTRWCTAAEKNNQFWEYHKKAPLILVVIPELKEKGKFQFWVTEHSVQFMDAADSPVSEVLIAEYWTHFEQIISFALQRNGRALEYLPKRLRTHETCLIAVTRNGGALEYVPQKLRTEEMCRIAVEQNGKALAYVPKTLRTEEICKIAVTQNGAALDYIPQKLRTDELFKFVVARNGTALFHAPEKIRTDEMCRIAVAQNGRALDHVPKKLRTEEMCRIAVAQNGYAFYHVPEDLRTDEMRRIAVTQNGHALYHVPEHLRTEDLCRIAVAQEGWVLHYVPKNLRTQEICRIAVAQNGRALHDVPEEMRTDEMCRIAVEQNGMAVDGVPQKLCTEDLCRIAVEQDGMALACVPHKLRTEVICKLAVSQDVRALEYVPDHLRDRMNCPTPSPMPEWDISLLDELANILDATSSPAPSGPPHA